MLETLSNSLKSTLKKIARSIFVDERVINDLVKDLQKALLQADVNVKLVFELTNKIKERALKEETPKNLSKREHLINIVYEELVNFLGDEKSEIKPTSKKPFKVMLVGLLGSGKTTTATKLANYYLKRGHKVATLGLDTYRPAATDQLLYLSEQIKIPCYIDKSKKDPLEVYKKFEKEMLKYDLVVIDTAGRHALDTELIKEIERLNVLINPDENLLVLGAEVGQAAFEQASAFNKSCKISGIIVTKLDGTARGGGALSASAATGAKIKFIGVGEKSDDIESFNPKGFVSRLLGMGDLETLLEKTKEVIEEEKAEDLGRKMLKGDFNFVDLYEQMQAMRKLGPLNKIMDLIPGMGNLNIPKDMLNVQEEKLGKWKHVMDSMRKEELERPDEVLTSSRINRIAKGAGVAATEVRGLLKQYKESKKLIKKIHGKDPSRLLKSLNLQKFKF